MSGRIHIFMLPEHREKLEELTSTIGVEEERFGESHLVQAGVDYLLQLEKDEKLTDDQIKELKDVPDPVNYGHTTVYLKQVYVNKAFKFIEKYEMSHHDYALGHFCTLGFLWLLTEIQKGGVDEQWMKKLKDVKPPKKVMYAV